MWPSQANNANTQRGSKQCEVKPTSLVVHDPFADVRLVRREPEQMRQYKECAMAHDVSTCRSVTKDAHPCHPSASMVAGNPIPTLMHTAPCAIAHVPQLPACYAVQLCALIAQYIKCLYRHTVRL